MNPIPVPIGVTEQNGFFVCNPTQQTVKPGELVIWQGNGVQAVMVSFTTNGSPFVEGLGPRDGMATWTVRTTPPPPSGSFHPTIAIDGKALPTKGDIIFP